MSFCTKTDKHGSSFNSNNSTSIKSFYQFNVQRAIKPILKQGGPLCKKCGRYVGGEIVTVIDGQHYCANCWE